MFTKLFTKSHDPYELGGRWAKFKIDRNTETIECDLEIESTEFTSTTVRFTLKDKKIDPINYVLTDVNFISTATGGVTRSSSFTINYAKQYSIACSASLADILSGYFYYLRK